MWPWKSRRSERASDLFQLAELLLVKKVEAEARVEEARANAALKNLERELKYKEQELSWHAAKREERRERAKTQRRNPRPGARNRFGPVRHGENECGLCVDAMRRDVTVEMIQAHATHIVPAAYSNGEAKP